MCRFGARLPSGRVSRRHPLVGSGARRIRAGLLSGRPAARSETSKNHPERTALSARQPRHLRRSRAAVPGRAESPASRTTSCPPRRVSRPVRGRGSHAVAGGLVALRRTCGLIRGSSSVRPPLELPAPALPSAVPGHSPESRRHELARNLPGSGGRGRGEPPWRPRRRGERIAFDGAAADVAGGEDPGDGGLQRQPPGSHP